MKKIIITLRSAPNETVEVPEKIKYKGDKEETIVERSCFGAIRIFSGIPKTISAGELEHIKKTLPLVYKRLDFSPYVESKRVDTRRGASESEINKLADENGLGHLKMSVKVKRLKERKLIKEAVPHVVKRIKKVAKSEVVKKPFKTSKLKS